MKDKHYRTQIIVAVVVIGLAVAYGLAILLSLADEVGRSAGYATGYSEGYDFGYEDGYSDGRKTEKTSSNVTVTFEQNVCVSDGGYSYHYGWCPYLGEKIVVSLSDAKAYGYTRCANCNPPA